MKGSTVVTRPEGAVKASDVPRLEQLKGCEAFGIDALGNVTVNGSRSGTEGGAPAETKTAAAASFNSILAKVLPI
jgi:hypothetical protein